MEGVKVKVIAGRVSGVEGPIKARTPAIFLDLHFTDLEIF